ncbi:hypothetical protein [Maricaulis sp. CAU 1757]
MQRLAAATIAISTVALATGLSAMPASPSTATDQALTIWPETEHEFEATPVTDITGQASGSVETVIRTDDGAVHSYQILWEGPDGSTLGMIDHPAGFVRYDADTDKLVAHLEWRDLQEGFRQAEQNLLNDFLSPPAPEPGAMSGTS